MPITRRNMRRTTESARVNSEVNRDVNQSNEELVNKEEFIPIAANDEEEEEEEEMYELDGQVYNTYQAMVDAKRKRNQKILEQSGLLEAIQISRSSNNSTSIKPPTKRGLQKRKTVASSDTNNIFQYQRRKSSRLQGHASDGMYIDEERAGKFIVRTDTVDMDGGKVATTMTRVVSSQLSPTKPEYYRNRINDGAPVTIAEAVQNLDKKWRQEDSVIATESFVRQTLQTMPQSSGSTTSSRSRSHAITNSRIVRDSPTSVTTTALTNGNLDKFDWDTLSADNTEMVAKVCPDRIYAMSVHPSSDKLVICAGDKLGHIGIWNTGAMTTATTTTSLTKESHDGSDGVHLFRPHMGAVSCLEWTCSNGNSTQLFSSSYDGTCRLLDVEAGHFEEVFATYNDDVAYTDKLGFGLDIGSRFWTQYGCLDHRSPGDKCLFLSTSVGTAMHVDTRVKGKITWHEELSEKKINTLSLHPNGHSLISAGLDCTIHLWDLRKLGDSRTRNSHTKAPSSLAHYNGGRSVNSAFFSPSGQYVVSTTMANKLDVFQDFHFTVDSGKKDKSSIVKPMHSIRHDNMTGRWLTTFQAIFHPQLDHLFAVGSMRKPRCLELFDPMTGESRTTVVGEALTAVASRLAFHPRTDRIILVGGNSSGRVTIVQQK